MTTEFQKYIDITNDERRRIIVMLHDTILGLYPAVEQKISYHILMYKLKTGKGCINLKFIDELPLKDIEQVIKFAMELGRYKPIIT